MLKHTLIYTVLLFSSQILYPESGDNNEKDKTDIIPLLYYKTLSLEKQSFYNYGGGIVIEKGSEKAEYCDQENSLLAVLLYSGAGYTEKPLYEYPDKYKNIELILQRKKDRHQYFSVLQSYSDKPVTGGLETYAFLAGYGYEIVQTKNHSLYLGGSLAVSDWDIEMENGSTWPVIPLPFIHYEYSSPLLFSSFDLTSSPVIDLVIAPENRLRLNTSILIADPEAWDNYGIKYDVNIEYRFFSKDYEYGDFAGIRMGIMTDDYCADLSGEDERTIQTGWRTYYAALDLSLLEISFGYAEGKTFYEEGHDRDPGRGLYFSIQIAYLF